MRIASYEVVKKLGEGNFGRTFLGRHVHLGIFACIKQEKTGNPTFMQLFRDEAMLLSTVHHLSLPAFREYLELPDFGQVLLMSFIEGENLQAQVARQGAIDDEHIAWILQRLLDAVGYLHYRGIVHCDIKPDNVILHVEEHNAVLVDFGLSIANPGFATQAKGGTEAFMPPEFALGNPPIPASDIYSLGKTAVFLAGGDPYTGQLPRDMHPLLAECVRAMIQNDPFARPQNARDLCSSLTEIRRKAFGRAETREMFKLRNKRGVS